MNNLVLIMQLLRIWIPKIPIGNMRVCLATLLVAMMMVPSNAATSDNWKNGTSNTNASNVPNTGTLKGNKERFQSSTFGADAVIISNSFQTDNDNNTGKGLFKVSFKAIASTTGARDRFNVNCGYGLASVYVTVGGGAIQTLPIPVVSRTDETVDKFNASIYTFYVNVQSKKTNIQVGVRSDVAGAVNWVVVSSVTYEKVNNGTTQQPQYSSSDNFLKLNANDNSGFIQFRKEGDWNDWNVEIQYSNDPNTENSWADMPLNNTQNATLYVRRNEPVYFRAKNQNQNFSKSETQYYHYILGGNATSFSAGGPVMSLLNKYNTTANSFPNNNGAYFANLFLNCSKLYSAPILNAQTLVQGCYLGMFQGCTALTTAPALPAQSMAANCCKNMFNGCSNLNNVQFDWLNNLAEGCFEGMFQGCQTITAKAFRDWNNFNELPASCFKNMYNGCTGITSYPDITVNSMGTSACEGMFQGCNNANFKTAPNIIVNGNMGASACKDMFSGCSNLTKSSTITVTGNMGANSCQNMFAGITSLTTANAINVSGSLAESCCEGMFQGCSALTTAPTLSATTLATSCYKSMFEGTGLRTAPALPAAEMAENCYQNMFKDCSALGTAPALNAMTLAQNCYAGMFENSGLLAASALPATQMAQSCYAGMFKGCTSLSYSPDLQASELANYCCQSMFEGTALTTAPSLPATQMALNCYEAMFRNCASLTSLPELPADQLANSCYESMFESCASLVNAPFLPATTLYSDCYKYMFKGCGSLKRIDVGFTGWGQNDNAFTTDWVSGVGTGGTFYGADELDKSKVGTSNVPSGWDIFTNVATVNYLCFTSLEYDVNISLEKICPEGEDPSVFPDVQLQYCKGAPTVESNWHDFEIGACEVVGRHWVTSGFFGLDSHYEPTLNDKGITISKNNKLYLRAKGDESISFSKDRDHYYHFLIQEFAASGFLSSIFNGRQSGGKVDVSGNVMSLVDKSCLQPYVEPFTFYKLFESQNQEKEEVNGALGGLISYTVFRGAFHAAPQLPAITLAESCYESMFAGCKYLTFGPKLPASKLYTNCYKDMFNGCEKLSYLNVDFTSWTAYKEIDDPEIEGFKITVVDNENTATENWVAGVSETGSFFCESSLNIDENNDSHFGPNLVPKNSTYKWPVVTRSYLRFAPFEEGNVRISIDVPNNVLLYRYNDTEWADYTTSMVLTLNHNSDQKEVFFCAGSNGVQGKNTEFNTQSSQYKFTLTGKVIATGNIMSLVDYECSQLSLKPYMFKGLFEDCSTLVNAANGDMISLPATSLAAHCYENMFKGCTGLSTTPVLGATVMEQSCYQGMFQDCDHITVASTLPALSLAQDCYKSMFEGCYSLINAPELPAVKLKNGCYENMFKDCASLKYIKVAFKAWNEYDDEDWNNHPYTTNWVDGVRQTNDGTFYCPEVLKERVDVHHMPNWKNVIEMGQSTDYLCLTSHENSNLISLKMVSAAINASANPFADVHLEYQVNGIKEGSWISFTPAQASTAWSVTLQKSERVYIRAASTNSHFNSADYYVYFASKYSFSASGNVMSLLSKNPVETTSVPTYAFHRLFYNSKLLQTAPEISATIIGERGCYRMFQNCTALEETPSLNAETIFDFCYAQMFYGCTNLKRAHDLPAMTLVSSCYRQMFYNCTNLVQAPDLPATNLTSRCYQEMFSGCSKLSAITVGFNPFGKNGQANWTNATENWVNGVAESGTFMAPNFTKAEQDLDTSEANSDFGASRIPKDNEHKWVVNPSALCITSPTGATVSLEKIGSLTKSITLEYRTNNSVDWSIYSPGVTQAIQLEAGQSVYFRAPVKDQNGSRDYTVNKSFSESNADYYHFNIQGSVNLSGDLLSLLDGRCPRNLSGYDHVFARLFEGNSGILTAPHLNATTLSVGCYEGMFRNCTSLTTAPELPATAVTADCYKEMFSGCTGLVDAPALSAEAMASGCYQGMFYNCEDLMFAPDLPAKTLEAHCYEDMFHGCLSLTVAPELVATQLEPDCYRQMFMGCEKLGNIRVSFTDWGTSNEYTSNWVNGVAKTGVFMCPDNLVNGLADNDTWYNFSKIPYSATSPWNVNPKYPTFTAKDLNSTIGIHKQGNPYSKVFQYSMDMISWEDYPIDTENMIFVKNGYSIYFRAKPTDYENNINTSFQLNGKNVVDNVKTDDDYYQFKMTGKFQGQGRIKYLTRDDDTEETEWEPYTYYKLFSNCSGLTSGFELTHKLSPYAYAYMYENCTSLVYGGARRSTNWSSWNNCEGCFMGMFSGCTSLKTTLQLNYTINMNDKDRASSRVFKEMYKDCSSLEIAPELPATLLAPSCYESMFQGCTSLKVAPELPATTLAADCYKQMFMGCKALNFITVAFKSWTDEDHPEIENPYTNNWVKNVSPKGNFIGPAEIKDSPNNDHRIPIGWGMADPAYLCITPLSDYIQFFIDRTDGSTNDIPFQYRINDGEWKQFDQYTYCQGAASNNDKIYIKASHYLESLNTASWSYRIHIRQGSAVCALSGNLMSLLDPSGTREDVPDYAFYRMFQNASWIKTASQLNLPASKVGKYSYAHMFDGCVNLVSAPYSIAVESMDDYSCEGMFKGCTALKTGISQLSAESMGNGSYKEMFMNCSSLASAPELASMYLAPNCYQGMFENCASLASVPSELPAEVVYASSYESMFKGCTNLTSVPALPALTLAENCYKEMFYGCSSINSAPDLPATTLVDGCYAGMFKNCSSLKRINVKFSSWGGSTYPYTLAWVENVNHDGMFIGPHDLPTNDLGVNSIPLSWITLMYDNVISTLPNGEAMIDDGWKFNDNGASFVPTIIDPMTGTGAIVGYTVVNIPAGNVTFDVPNFDKAEMLVFVGTTAESSTGTLTVNGVEAAVINESGNGSLSKREYDVSSLALNWGDDLTLSTDKGLYGIFLVIGREKLHSKTPTIKVSYKDNLATITTRPLGSKIYWSTSDDVSTSSRIYSGPIDLNTLGGEVPEVITIYTKAYPENFASLTEEEYCASEQATEDVYFYPKTAGYCLAEDVDQFKFALMYAKHAASADYRVKIFLPKQTYDLGADCMTEVGSYVSLIGQLKNGTIISSNPTETDPSKNATLWLSGSHIYVQDLTVKNSSADAPAILDNGSFNTYMRCVFESSNGAYTVGGVNQISYLQEVSLKGTTNLTVGDGTAWLEQCHFSTPDYQSALGKNPDDGKFYINGFHYKNCSATSGNVNNGDGDNNNTRTYADVIEMNELNAFGWDPKDDAVQATINPAKSTRNGCTMNVYSDESNVFMVGIDGYKEYTLAEYNSFYISAEMAGKSVIVRAANTMGGFGDETGNIEEISSDGEILKTVKLNPKGYASFYYDRDVVAIGASAYTANYNEAHNVVTLYHINESDIIPAGTGVVLFGRESSTVELHEADGSGVSVATNGLTGRLGTGNPGDPEVFYNETSDSHVYYVVSDGEYFKRLKKGSKEDGTAGTIKQNKAFFCFDSDPALNSSSSDAGAYRMVFRLWEEEEEEQETGITNHRTSNQSGPIYNLNGQITDHKKGLLVKNHKVVLLK